MEALEQLHTKLYLIDLHCFAQQKDKKNPFWIVIKLCKNWQESKSAKKSYTRIEVLSFFSVKGSDKLFSFLKKKKLQKLLLSSIVTLSSFATHTSDKFSAISFHPKIDPFRSKKLAHSSNKKVTNSRLQLSSLVIKCFLNPLLPPSGLSLVSQRSQPTAWPSKR